MLLHSVFEGSDCSSPISQLTLSSSVLLHGNRACPVSNNYSLLWHLTGRAMSKNQPEQAPRATNPSDEQGTHSVPLVNPNDSARWLALANVALRTGATVVVEGEALARKEQNANKRRSVVQLSGSIDRTNPNNSGVMYDS